MSPTHSDVKVLDGNTENYRGIDSGNETRHQVDIVVLAVFLLILCCVAIKTYIVIFSTAQA